MNNYILDEQGNPVAEPDLLMWARWFDVEHRRRLALDKIGEITVSTVFLGVDHNFLRQGAPLLYETMIFGALSEWGLDDYQNRYATREEALQGHAEAVALVRAKRT